MNLNWVYAYPTWALFVGLVFLFMALTVGGIFLLRPWTDKLLGITSEDNGIVSEYMGITGVFFGLVLGMVAVGAWESYGAAKMAAQSEASQMDKLYRSVALLPDSDGGQLKAKVRLYAEVVIKHEWPEQTKGKPPSAGERVISEIGQMIYALPTDTSKQEITTAVAVDRYFELIDARKHRVQSVNGMHLPGSLWWVVVAATFIIISLSMLLHLPNRKLDIAINLLMSLLMGSILGFIIAMDNPFMGDLSVDAKAYQQILDGVMAEK